MGGLTAPFAPKKSSSLDRILRRLDTAGAVCYNMDTIKKGDNHNDWSNKV